MTSQTNERSLIRCARLILFCIVLLSFLNGNSAESSRRRGRQRRLTEINRRTYKMSPKRESNLDRVKTNQFKSRDNRLSRRNRHRSHKSKKSNRRYRNDVIKRPDLSFHGLYQLLDPGFMKGRRVADVLGPSEMGVQRGVVRVKRLYCRAGIGFHLEIQGNGTITANHAPSPEGVLEVFSVDQSVVGIRSARLSLYLCMGRNGKIFAQEMFGPECRFRENIEGNNFNTYASELYSDHKTRKGYFLAITRQGKIARRMKRFSYKQKKTHWLQRTV